MGTTYQPLSVTGGYSEVRLAPDSYKVSVGGNGFVTLSFIEGMAMLRAAELTRDAGYDRFVVTRNGVGIGGGDIVAGLAGREEYNYVRGGEPNMSRLYLSAGLTPKEPYNGPSSLRAPRVDKPVGFIVIRMVKGSDPDAVDAAALISRLKPIYVAR